MCFTFRLILTVLFMALGYGPSLASDFYKVSVTRKGQDLYLIDGQNIYIKTRYCYEYAYSEEAILQIDSLYGYNVGQINFTGLSGTKCDVEKIIR
jgi:hypothetical protein